MEDKKVFEFYKEFFSLPVKNIQEDEDGNLVINFFKEGYSTPDCYDKDWINIEWTHESKIYPPPVKENKYLPVPDWLRDWTPETLVMTGSPFFIKIPFSHISNNEVFPFRIHNNGYSEISQYDPSRVGQHGINDRDINASDLFKMDPLRLTHIPGHFYKTIEQRIELVPPLEALGVEADIWGSKSDVDYIIMKKDGDLEGYHGQNPPLQSIKDWHCNNDTDSYYIPVDGRPTKSIIKKYDLNWKNCIWKRPESGPVGTPKNVMIAKAAKTYLSMGYFGIKPSEIWADPKYNYFTIDKNGLACRFVDKPEKKENLGVWDNRTSKVFDIIEEKQTIPPGVDWKTLIWERPKNTRLHCENESCPHYAADKTLKCCVFNKCVIDPKKTDGIQKCVYCENGKIKEDDAGDYTDCPYCDGKGNPKNTKHELPK